VIRLGSVVITPGAIEEFSGPELADCLQRHAREDWGSVDRFDWSANNRALRDGTRLLSVYRFEDGRTLWIITEADRSSTCLLRPEDY